MKWHRQILICTAFFVSVVTAATSAFAQIQDEANLFSSSAVQDAEKIINSIRATTSPPKTVLVKTVSKISGDPQIAAEDSFRNAGVNGIQIFMSTEPRKLIITVGKETENGFRQSAEVRDLMLGAFRSGKFDDGLRSGLTFISQKLVSSFPSRGRAPIPASAGSGERTTTEASPESGMPGWLLPALIIGAAALFLFRRRPQNSGPYRNEGQQSTMPGQNNSGWGSSILGGLGGALAGNWLYDRFLGGTSDSHASPHSSSHPDTSQVPQNDYGDVGSSEGGDWGSSDSSGFDGGADGGGGDW